MEELKMTYLSNTKLYENKVDEAYHQLGYAIVMQAVKDYLKASDDENKNAVLKDLRGEWLNSLTDGTARIVAERLLIDAEGIKERIRKSAEDEEEMEEFVC
jgi:hypothetical protein